MLKPKFYVAAILLAFLLPGVGWGDQAIQIDNKVLADITGTWRVVTGLADGQALPEMTLRQSYVFVDDQLSVTAGEQTFLTAKIQRMSFIDPIFESVVYIDFASVDKTGAASLFKGILQLHDGMMILCTAKVGKQRPAAFSSRIHNGCSLLVMKRVRNPAKEHGNVGDTSKVFAEKILTELQNGIAQSQSESQGPADENEQISDVDKEFLSKIQGTWISVSNHLNGKDTAGDIPTPFYTIEVEGDRYLPIIKHRIVANLKVSRLVKVNDHLEIDIIEDDPQKKPSHGKAIVKLEDDALTLCVDLKSGDRPREFVSHPDSGLILMVLRRMGSTEASEVIFKSRQRRLMGQKVTP